MNNIETKENTSTSKTITDRNHKNREQLLSEVAEKACSEQRQIDEETCQVAEQLKEEIYQESDEPSTC